MNEFIQFVISHWTLWLAFAILIVLVTQIESTGKVRGVKRASPQEVTDLMNHQKGVLVDIRGDEDFSESHISGATNIPFDDLEKNINKISKKKENPIILVDSSGMRSVAAGALLRRHGFESLYSLHGGIKAWRAASMPLVSE